MGRSKTNLAVKPRVRLDVDERRAQLLALGIRVFSQRPYDDVTIDDLARAAGVSKGLLYHYFATKRDFYVAALDHASRELLASALEPEGETPQERLRRGLATYLAFVERHGNAYVALIRGGIGSDPEVSAILERTRATFVERLVAETPLEQHVPPIVRTAMRGWIGFVEASAIDWLETRAVPREAVVELLAGVLFQAVEVALRSFK